jgi:hypothetical protein
MMGAVRAVCEGGRCVILRAESEGVVWFIENITISPVERNEARWRMCGDVGRDWSKARVVMLAGVLSRSEQTERVWDGDEFLVSEILGVKDIADVAVIVSAPARRICVSVGAASGTGGSIYWTMQRPMT